MICEIRWPKPHEHCTWCDKDLNAAPRLPVAGEAPRVQVLVDGRGWVYCSLTCLLTTEKAVIDSEEVVAQS